MRPLLTFLLFIFFLNANQAQNSSCERWSMGTNFTLTAPLDEMADNNFRANYGITFNALYNLNPQNTALNFHIGGKFTGGMARGERDNIILEDPSGASARSSVYNTLVDIGILGRMVLAKNEKVKTYFDIFGGGRLLGANHDIRLRRRVSGYDRRTSDRINQSSNWAWGTGTGVLVHLNQNVYLDFGINYTQSNSNEFVDMSTVKAIDDIIQYETVNSISNSFGLHLGFHFNIGCQQYEKDYHDEDPYRGNVRSKRDRRKPRAKKSSRSKN